LRYLRTAARGCQIRHRRTSSTVRRSIPEPLRTVDRAAAGRQGDCTLAGHRRLRQYMVDVMGCRDCHESQLQGKLRPRRTGPPPGPNLTRIVRSGPRKTSWPSSTPACCRRRNSANPNTARRTNRVSQRRGPSSAAATDNELKAVYAYLRSLPVVAAQLLHDKCASLRLTPCDEQTRKNDSRRDHHVDRVPGWCTSRKIANCARD
jgi:hypothetical protein